MADYIDLERFNDTVWLCDANTKKDCFPKLKKLPHDKRSTHIEIAPGEDQKSLANCQKIWQTLLESKIDRSSLFINLGGGVVCDLGGFVASTYKRGMPFVNVPTTLLAQIDAAIGGKTGVDLAGLKNMVGTFAFPEVTLINPAFLQTLPKRQIASGFAEMIKYAIISKGDLWQRIQDFDIYGASHSEWTELIKESAEIKIRIVEQDPRETGVRKSLNFGHTIGHALESASHDGDQPLLHGEAIAVGMICAMQLAVDAGFGSTKKRNELTELVLKTFGKVEISATDCARIHRYIKNDKKATPDNIRFTLVDKQDRLKLDEIVSPEAIQRSIDHYRSL